MIRSLKVAGVFLLASATALAQPADNHADPGSSIQRQKRVLVVYATRPQTQLATLGDRELPRILEKGLSAGIDYYSEYIDEGRFPQPDYRIAFRDFIASKYRGRQLDLAIAMGQKPLEFAITNRAVLFAGTPIVYFADFDDPVPNYPNSTGVVAKANLAGTISLATALQPDTRNVFVVAGVGFDAFLEVARRQLRAFEPRLAITYLAGLPTADLEARLTRLPPHSIVYFLVVSSDGAGQSFHPLEYLSHITTVASVPVYSWVDAGMDRGIVGGDLKDQGAQIEAVGQLAVRVLRAGTADGIPPVTEDLNVTQVDWRQLQRWGISESRVPPGTVIRFKEPTMWDRYAPYLVAVTVVLIAQSVLIGGLLIQRVRRRQAEAHLSENEIELRHSDERIRSLGARLLNAQESERARVARDLHDDISQQMALLEIDLEQLAGVVNGQAEILMQDTLHRAQEIGRSVHDLSHRLHPAKLRLIGLVAALQGLRRELSNQNIDITFNHKNVPAVIPEELALCLFRIVQEALHNAIKYSQGRHVTVDLGGGPSGLALTVTDDGVGFDVNTTWRKGLGLISMRERLEAVGGSLVIHSYPGAGTRLEVSVPLRLDPEVAA